MSEHVDEKKPLTLDEEIENLSHEDLLEITQSSLRRLIAADPLLCDLPVDVTAEEVAAQIAVAQGKSITVAVTRYSESPLKVVIPQRGTTLSDLKKAIKRTFALTQQRQKSKTKISWGYIWRTYDLQNVETGRVMKNDKKEVMEYVLEAQRYPWLEQIARQEQLTMGCDNLGVKFRSRVKVTDLDHILVDHKHKLLYCYVPKIACTNWKRVMMVLTGESSASNLVEIPATLAHSENSTLRLSQLSREEAKACLKEYTTFLIARHPFERLLSAYRNKFVDNLPSSKYFQARYGRYILRKYRPDASKSEIQSGANVTFQEFVHYLLKEGINANEHWTPIYDLCFPCTLNYTFIGHYETLSEDARTVLDMVGAPPIVFPVTRNGHTKEHLRWYFQQLSIFEIQALYKTYEKDFKLFGYGLEEMLGYDLA